MFVNLIFLVEQQIQLRTVGNKYILIGVFNKDQLRKDNRCQQIDEWEN